MSANCLDRIGLILGLLSGLLLIPEVFKLLQVELFQKAIEKQLDKFETWSKFPLRFQPPSWKKSYSQAQREALEPITAISALIFSIVWIGTLVTGIIYSSRFLVILSFIMLMAATLRQIRVS